MTLDWTALAGETWTARTASGDLVSWSGFHTGPLVLSGPRLEEITRTLLQVPLEKVEWMATAELACYVADDTEQVTSLIMHSATQTTKGFEGDLTDTMAGRQAYDVATYLEARAVTLGRPGDLAVGRSGPWRDSVRRAGIDSVDVGDLSHYYLSHALLLAASRHIVRPEPAMTRLVSWLRDHPHCVVRLYALDVETQVFLLWLKRQARLPALRVDANSAVISAQWNNKSHIHPPVARARALNIPDSAGAMEVLDLEQRESAGCRRLGMRIPVLPGYLIPRDDDPDGFCRGVLDAAQLLRERYGLSLGCLKPCEAGDGARIVVALDLTDPVRLERAARAAYPHGDDYLLEAHLDLLSFRAAGRELALAPSGHIRNGHVAEGLTAQILNGNSWEGNGYFDRRTCESLGVSPAHYEKIAAALRAIHEAFLGEQSVLEGCHGGLVTGGIDFLIGRAGGRFGSRTLVGTVDFNLSSHGAEYMRAFRGEAGARYPDPYVATRVYRPSPGASLAATDEAIAEVAEPGQIVKTVACVPRRWGMVATTGQDTLSSIQNAFTLVQNLVARGLAEA